MLTRFLEFSYHLFFTCVRDFNAFSIDRVILNKSKAMLPTQLSQKRNPNAFWDSVRITAKANT